MTLWRMCYYNKVNKLNFLFLIQHSRSAYTKTLGEVLPLLYVQCDF